MKTREYISAAKKALGGISDYALAKHLELTRSAVSQLVNGQTVMSATTAARVAEILGVDPLKVIADVELERGSSPELWKRIRAAAAWTAMTIGAASFGIAPQDARAAFVIAQGCATTTGSGQGPHIPARNATEIHIAQHRRRRTLGAVLAALLAWLLGALL